MKFLSIDGGGTKVKALLFDDGLHRLSYSLSGGVNPSQTPVRICEEHVDECLRQLLDQSPVKQLETVYCVGMTEMFKPRIERWLNVRKWVSLHEGYAGMVTASLRQKGYLALAGTGSDVFYLNGNDIRYSGGQGPILGDDGGGVWIGREAARAVVRDLNGWGQSTMLSQSIFKAWKIEDLDEMVQLVHSSRAPYAILASLTGIVGRTALEGDEVAVHILEEAGMLMARQLLCLIDTNGFPWDEDIVAVCGGAWKSGKQMFQSFSSVIQERYPQADLRLPLFECVCAGPFQLMTDMGENSETIRRALELNFIQEKINWNKAFV